MRKSLLTFSIVTVLSSTSALAFVDEENFSFGNRLIDAVNQNNTEIVEAILANGEDPNTTGKFDTSALHRAAYNGNAELIKILVASGADVDIRDYGGASPLHIAARTGNLEAASILLSDKADINTIDSQGYSPLHRAIVNNQLPVSFMLINKGANINTVNNEGDTPLIDAVRVSSPKLVKELIVRGADKTIKNYKGLDAIDYAMRVGNNKIDSLLSRSVQDLMKENSLSSETVVASNVITKPAEPAPVPDFLKKEAEVHNSVADVAPYVSQGTGDQYIEAIKVPVDEVQEEVIDQPPVTEQVQDIQPAKQVEERYQFTEIEQKKYQSNAEESDLQKAPRLPDDGKLPKSLRVDFMKSVQDQKQQNKIAEAEKNMQPIELPKDVSEIENTYKTITLPQETKKEPVKKAEPVKIAEIAEKLPVPQEEETEKQNTAVSRDVPEFMKIEAYQDAQNSAQGQQIQLAQAKVNYQQIETYSDVPVNNYVTRPVDSIQVISSGTLQNSLPDEQQEPVYDQQYANEVDALMQSYTENAQLDKNYEAEVNSLMNQLILADDSQYTAPELQSRPFQPPAFPASLAIRQAIDNLNLRQNPNAFIQQNIQPTNYISQPVDKGTTKIINENMLPQIGIPQVSETEPQTIVYQAPVMKKSKNKAYDVYRASLVKDINEFYNKDYQPSSNFDISDLERQRMNNLRLTPQAEENNKDKNISENKDVLPKPSEDVIAAPLEQKVEETDMEKLQVLEKKTVEVNVEVSSEPKKEDKKDDTIKDIDIDEMLKTEGGPNDHELDKSDN